MSRAGSEPVVAGGRDRRKPDRSADAGFSLIELIAVMFIVAMAVSIAVMHVPRRSGQPSLAALVGETAGRLRAARDHAIRWGRDTTLVVDLQQRLIATEGAAPLAIADDIDVDVTASAQESRSKTIAGIRFFPDGASSGGTIRLGQHGRFHEIRVNWFTGRISRVPPT